MKKLRFTGVLTLIVILIIALPAMAQDDAREPGSGAPLIYTGGDFTNLNPILQFENSSAENGGAIMFHIFPYLLGVDPDTGYWGAGMPQQIVSGWTISDDGLTYTFNLRDDMVWSDGVPITSADMIYFWEVVNNPNMDLPTTILTFTGVIESITAPDDYTLEVTFFEPDCNALHTVRQLPIVPAHHFRELFPEPTDMIDSSKNMDEVTDVYYGPYSFGSYRPGEQFTLLHNPDYTEEAVMPAGIIYKIVPDQTLRFEQFLVGDISVTGVPITQMSRATSLVEAGEYHTHWSSRTNMRFISFNMADPQNPQPGQDEEGNLIDQGLHPVFGDVRVRQALNYAMDFEGVNQGMFYGYGVQGTTHSTPYNWAHPDDLEPYAFDQQKAIGLLEEAGWVDTDGDGVRECRGCLYATQIDPEFEGSPLTFELVTNAGNDSNEALGPILQDQWGEVGAVVDFQTIDFNILVEDLMAQTYDAIMIFWGFGFPVDPDGTRTPFGIENDVPEGGFNTGSYYNARVQEIMDSAQTLPGCDREERKVLYQEMYRILHEDTPWIWIGTSEALTLAQPDIEGWDPKPLADWEAGWNSNSWYIAP